MSLENQNKELQYSFWEKIFSIKNNNTHKIITMLGCKIKLKRNGFLKNNKELKEIYDDAFYTMQAKTSYESGVTILKMLNQIIPNINSVLDVGCGCGTWLHAWQNVNKDIAIQGIDANELPENALYVERKNIIITDLEKLGSIPLTLTKDKYDLVQSVEVGEHLSAEVAKKYVHFLCQQADMVLFSAALPYQRGVNHINEQYAQYWCDLFKEENFECFDILRTKLWNDETICWWYRQNLFIYATKEKAAFLKNIGYTPVAQANTYYHPKLINQLLNA